MERKKTSKSIKIKMGLLKNGVKQVDIANKIGCSKSLVSRVISGSSKSKVVAQAIKDITGVEL